MKPITLYLVDDYLLTRISQRLYFTNDNLFEILDEFSNPQDCIKQMRKRKADVILIDIELLNHNNSGSIRTLKKENPYTKIIIGTSNFNDERLLTLLSYGVDGFILKNYDTDIKKTIQMAVENKFYIDLNILQKAFSNIPMPETIYFENLLENKKFIKNLTSREIQVLKYLIEGYTNTEIAAKMAVSINTIKAHVGNILEKFNVQDRVQAVVKAVRTGLF